MATVTTQRSETRFLVELSTDEALYVHHALRLVSPSRDQFATELDPTHDPVYEALSDAIADAGFPCFGAHAQAL